MTTERGESFYRSYPYVPTHDPDELEYQTKERFWCEEHNCMLIQDALGDWVCVVCLVEDRLDIKEITDGST